MADDKVDKKPPASFLALPVSVEKNKEKQGPPSSAVQLVSLWALLNAVVLLGSFAFTYALCQLHITLVISRKKLLLFGCYTLQSIDTSCCAKLCSFLFLVLQYKLTFSFFFSCSRLGCAKRSR